MKRISSSDFGERAVGSPLARSVGRRRRDVSRRRFLAAAAAAVNCAVELLSADKSDDLHGTLAIDQTTGKLTYTPDWTFIASDIFFYLVRNANGVVWCGVVSQGQAAIRGNGLLGTLSDIAGDPRSDGRRDTATNV